MAKRTIDKTKLNAVERDLVEGMEGFLGNLRSGAPPADRYTCHRVVLDLQTRTYSAKEVKKTRGLLKASQALFAQFLGVSAKTVRAWEQDKPPSDMACRFMDEIQRNPDYWRGRFKESAKIKTSR